LNLAAVAASAGMVLVATGIQAAVIKAVEGADPSPIPTVLGLMDAAPSYWQLFKETAPLTILITLIAALFGPTEPKTRPPRSNGNSFWSLHAKVLLLIRVLCWF
jgi:hypothetical protein